MNIVRSLGEIRKNRAQFKEWELEQRQKEAKREELAKINPPSEEELKQAKQFGKTVIDVVNVMDQHSEDVAQNIETAVQIPMTIVPFTTLVASWVLKNKFITNPAKKERNELAKKFLKDNDSKIKTLMDQFKSENPKKYSGLRPSEFLYKDFAENLKTTPHGKIEAKKIASEYLKITKIPRTKMFAGNVVPWAAMMVAFVFGNAYATKMQVGGSKVARHQSREVLKDPKYFVSYTPEQIDEARENLNQNKPSKNKDKLKSGMFKSIASVLKDNRAYQKWRNNYNPETQKVTRKLSEAELITAQKDQEVIQRVIKKINNTAEVYSTDMEVTGNVIMNGTPFLGLGVGFIVSKILAKTELLSKYIQKVVDKHGDEDAKKAYEELKKVPEGGAGRKRLYWKFVNKMMKSDVSKITNPTETEKVMHYLKKGQAVMLSGKLSRNWTMGLVVSFLSGIVAMAIGLKLQKASARAGRYSAKKELEQDPQSFIGYTKDEFDSVDAEPKKKPSKLKEMITFLPRVFKQYYEYQHYKNNDLKKEEALQKELIKLKVSDKQLKDAKDLQRKVFNTFEQVDDKSQDYSETVDMVTQTAQPFIIWGGILTAISPLIIFGIQAGRGKLTAKSITDKVIGFLSGSTKIMNTKFFKKYLTDVSKNVPYVVREMEAKDTVLKKIFENVELNKMIKNKDLTVGELINCVTKNINKLSKNDIEELVKMLKESPALKNDPKIQKLAKIMSVTRGKFILLLKPLKLLIGKKKVFPPDVIQKVENFRTGKKLVEYKAKIEKMTDAEFEIQRDRMLENFGNSEFFRRTDTTSINKAYMIKTLSKLETVVKNIPQGELRTIVDSMIDEFNKNPDQFVALVREGNVANIFNTPSLRKALKIAGLSWGAFNLAMIFVLESWFADMQLKAGRLGVMKALENLKDPAYYAEAEPD